MLESVEINTFVMNLLFSVKCHANVKAVISVIVVVDMCRYQRVFVEHGQLFSSVYQY